MDRWDNASMMNFPQCSCEVDITDNIDPMLWEAGDILAGLETENTYATYGKDGFTSYEQFLERKKGD